MWLFAVIVILNAFPWPIGNLVIGALMSDSPRSSVPVPSLSSPQSLVSLPSSDSPRSLVSLPNSEVPDSSVSLPSVADGDESVSLPSMVDSLEDMVMDTVGDEDIVEQDMLDLVHGKEASLRIPSYIDGTIRDDVVEIYCAPKYVWWHSNAFCVLGFLWM